MITLISSEIFPINIFSKTARMIANKKYRPTYSKESFIYLIKYKIIDL